ncbi:polysaccharide pyruvyl transferase family protein [Streptomyces rubiginosohelvolus]|uniref:polysaccharide pyruvyl transferase family protein n=1 Tax=Streptomyces rubiginosohelvolus TaxID=67362 RepID=UPI0036D8B600
MAHASSGARPPRILLRSAWQTVNIGDVAHTPGLLALLEKHIPDAEVQVWPSAVDNGVEAQIAARFPHVRVLKNTPESLSSAIVHNDFLLHGSGPKLMGARELAQWAEAGKPYGVYGITLQESDEETVRLLSGAEFVYFRDSVSLLRALEAGVSAPVVDFTPDSAFAIDHSDDAAARAFLSANGLEDGTFLCCLSRLRVTPYWDMYDRPMTERDRRDHAYNERMREQDHAPLRSAIESVVRNTDLKVLLSPEDSSQMNVARENIYDRLPADVQDRVVWRENFWTLGEALSVHARSAGLFGNEMHSPIMAVGHGVPALVCRWQEQTSKGFMWRDIGLGDWLFDMDDPKSVARIAPAVLSMAADPAAARAKAEAARETVHRLQAESMGVLAGALGTARRH